MARRLTVSLAAAAIAVAVGGAWLWFGRDLPRPATLRAEPTSALYALVDSRQADAAPVTVAEIFTPGTQTLGDLTREAVEELADCDDALWGASAPGCTQALRGTYRGSSVAGQFVIFNLPDGRTADALVAALRADGFVRQATPFDPARSRAEVRALGHYVTVSWLGATTAAPGTDLVRPLIALDALGNAIQARVLAAT